jgi:hypothetical protein
MEFLKNWAVFYKKQILFVLMVFLAASTSFALGYLANREFNHAPIIIEKCSDHPPATD